MVDNQLYFIAAVPPQPLLSSLCEFKQEVAREFHSKAALRSPPHVTVHMPFRIKAKKQAQLITGLSKFFQNQLPFQLELNGFGAFRPKVIFINVSDDPLLLELHQRLGAYMSTEMSIHNQDYRQNPFRPHLTIAFRDLKKAQFHKAWEYYEHQSFRASCLIDKITLLKHQGKRWEPQTEFMLGKQF